MELFAMKWMRGVLWAVFLNVIASSAVLAQDSCIIAEYRLLGKNDYTNDVYDELYECAKQDPRLRVLSIETIELIGEGISEAATFLRKMQIEVICHPEGKVRFSYSEWRDFLLEGKEILPGPARSLELLLLVGATSAYPCS
jgi:hypothetical protein